MTSKQFFPAFFCALFVLFSLGNAKGFENDLLKPLEGSRMGSKVQGLHNLKQYLSRYGYLNYQHTPNDVNSENDEFDQELKSALISYQKFYNLNASGTLDGDTISLMNMARCGMPDKKSGHKVHGTKLLQIVSRYNYFPNNPKWKKANLTYLFGSGYATKSYPQEYEAPVVSALNKWASASGYFKFSRASFPPADILILWQDGLSGGDAAPGGPILAQASAPTGGQFFYNGRVSWSVGPKPGYYDVETIALHEIGHLLGLDHSNAKDAIMFPTINSGITKGLNVDDIQGIKNYYGIK